MFTNSLLCLFSLLSFSLFADEPSIIYGDDGRSDVTHSNHSLVHTYQHSIAAKVKKTRLQKTGERYLLPSKKLKDRRPFCASVRYLEQKSFSTCTGFLVAEDLLLSAGHCMKGTHACENYYWIFDYVEGVDDLGPEQVYECAKVEALVNRGSHPTDYSLIRLKRKTVNRTSLPLRRKSLVAYETPLAVLGHPMGLPMKFTEGGRIRAIDKFHFMASVDTFVGNSGSPVFDSERGDVVGVLARGGEDYLFDVANRCFKENICKENSCRGEDVTHIRSIMELDTLLGD